MSAGAQTSRLAVLVFTDVVGSSELKNRLGVLTYAKLLARHDAIFRELLSEFPSAEVLQDTGDGFFAAFQTVGDAVRFALRFQDAMHREPWGTSEPFQTRVGIHLGELAHVAGLAGGPQKVVGIAADMTHRVMTLACGGQILLTRAAFDEARQFVSEYPPVNGHPPRALRWMAHGDYLFHGAAEPVQVFEVGGDGIAPLSPPRDREKARRQRSDENKAEILGWRPAIGLAVPQAPAWVLEKKLGEGTFGEVWLAHHATLRQKRVFKFCFDAQRLESFKRELTLFRLLRDALGERPDIARLHDVCFDRPPFFLETEYAPAGNLIDWAAAQGGLDRVPLETRLEIVAQVCDAVAAAHSVGVLHKDIKPSNILMHAGMNGAAPRPQLADFGIGLLTDKGQLAAHHITEAGFTSIEAPAESSRSGTRIYMPPEAMVGRPFTIQGDIYALGILLYQMVVGDLTRPMALGWERDVEDELLREDIAACVDGDPQRRANSAAEIATRLRRLPQRRHDRADEAHRRETARRRHQLLRVAQVIVVALVGLGSIAVIGFFRERRLRVRAEQSERATQIARADGLCDQGTALHLAGRGKESRDAFRLARETYTSFGLPTLVPDVGLYRSYRDFEAPILSVRGHTDGVMGAAWLPDGLRACSVSKDSTVKLWDMRTGTVLREYPSYTSSVLCLAISPDGKRLATGGFARSLRLWDIETRELRLLPQRASEVRGVAFSPDGKFLLSASKSPGIVQLWDVDSGQPVWSLSGGEDLCSVAFSPDGKRFLATNYNGPIHIWEVDKIRDAQKAWGTERRLSGHAGLTTSAVFLPDGRVLSSGMDRTIRLWNEGVTQDGHVLSKQAAGVRWLALMPPAPSPHDPVDQFLSCGLDGTLRLWDIKSGEVVRSFAGHEGAVASVAVSPSGSRAISAGLNDCTLRVWDLGPNLETRVAREDSGVTSVTCSADGLLIATGSWRGKVTLRDAATLRRLGSLEGLTGAIDCVRILSDGHRLFAADNQGAAQLWDFSASVIKRYPARRGPTTGSVKLAGREWCYSAVDPSGRFGISSSADRRNIELWSLQQPEEPRRTIGPAPDNDEVTCLTISADGTRALAGSSSGAAHEWDLVSGRCLATTRPSKQRVDRVVYSANSNRALIGGHDTAIHVWDLESRSTKRLAAGHDQPVWGLGFGHDRPVIYSSSLDQTLRMWDATSGADLNITAELDDRSYDLAVMPGDAVVCSMGLDVRVIDPTRARQHLDFVDRIPALRPMSEPTPTDPASLALLGEWYAFRGVDDWAVDLLERARSNGAAGVSALTLARCYWNLGRLADAAREFRNVSRSAAPATYINLCIAAVADQPPATTPATLPATTPAHGARAR